MSLEITRIFTEDMECPLGLDEALPRFSWQLASEKRNTLQKKYRIRIFCKKEELCWDSGVLMSKKSQGVSYEGEELKPVTRYRIVLQVWDNYDREAVKESWFETGLMNVSQRAWKGAQWISAPDFYVATDTRGVFTIESTFRLDKGSKRAGIVFGANDRRLLDKNQNEYGLEGTNYIRYEINLEREEAQLHIYRVGYAKNDRENVPLAAVPLVNFEGGEKNPLITEENRYDFHTLKITVEGNNAYAWLDEVLVDAVCKKDDFGTKLSGRTLNPRGFNDVLTYPRLNEIGFFAGKEDRIYFKNLSVSNVREPSRCFIREQPDGNLQGRSSVFAERIPVEAECFCLSGGEEGTQITVDPSYGGLPMFRSEFQVNSDSPVMDARLYITARGIYHCRINGKEITDRVLLPGLTQYDKRMNYQTFDVTQYITEGKNAIGVTLASGWWSDAQTFVVRNYNYFGDKEALLAMLTLTHKDGTEEVLVTSPESFRTFDGGPYRYGGLFMGEQYDASRAEIEEGYSRAGFDDREWKQPVTEEVSRIPEFTSMPSGFGRTWPAVHETNPEYIGGYDAPVYIVERRSARKRIQIDTKVWLYDMEQMMAGVPRIHFCEEGGSKITIRYAEVLYPDLPEYGENVGKIMVENYRDAASTDIYYCKGGSEGEFYQPRFTVHGYRYIEISGVTNAPEISQVESLQYSSVTEFEGSFHSSHRLLNRFAENVKWSQLCNFINIPTDCPQRNERMGWAGDTHIFCHTALQNSNLKAFYERNLQAMLDLQTEEGQFPEIAPIGGGFGGITYECAVIFIAWELYQQYGDKRTLQKVYQAIKKYMNYMKDKGLPGKGNISKVGPLGDWLAPEETDLQLLWNLFYYREADLCERIAVILGETDGQKEYKELKKRCKNYWNDTFVIPESGMTRTADGRICDTMCSYVLGLEYGIMENREAAARHLKRKAKESGYTVGTGFFGTGLLNQALCHVGGESEACRMMLQTDFPSWLYPVTQGATSVWEHWDSYTKEKGFGGQNAMNSFNHYSLGSVLSWMYSFLLGISRDETNPGYSHFYLEPLISEYNLDNGLTLAKGSVATPYGKICSEWEKRQDVLVYCFEIPVNTTASIRLPGRTEEVYGSGKYEIVIRNCEKW